MNSFELQSARTKDGLSDYDFVKIRAMEFLAKNVRKREDINWVGSWVVRYQRLLQASSEADKRKFFEVSRLSRRQAL